MVDENESARKPNRLIVFAVEDALIPKRRYLFFEAMRELGHWKALAYWVACLAFVSPKVTINLGCL